MSYESATRLKTPVLFLVFARPDTTRRVFDAIRQAKPLKLYVAADGPRPQYPEEAARCELSRRIATSVDWDCEVRTLFREENAGCGKGPSDAITWFFENESEGIILEDDCLPSPSFFQYCAELLERYRDDSRIMHIAGTNLAKSSPQPVEYSYSFSNITFCWGWATWRRAWAFHDFDMGLYNEINRKRYLDRHYNSIYERQYFQGAFARVYGGDRQNIWDYQWQFACRINSGLAIVPGRNMIVNLGLGENATNTTHPKGIGHHLKLEEIDLPLRHPEFVMVNNADERRMFTRNLTSWQSRVKSRVRELLPDAWVRRIRVLLKGLIFEGIRLPGIGTFSQTSESNEKATQYPETQTRRT